MAFADDAPIHLLMKKSRLKNKSGEWVEIGPRRIFFRSKWEVKYALNLERMKSIGAIKEWEYEPKTFWFLEIKRGVRSYKPDFRITNKDGSIWWAEVKGWMDPRSVTKIKRMKKYYPEEKISLIGPDWFKG